MNNRRLTDFLLSVNRRPAPYRRRRRQKVSAKFDPHAAPALASIDSIDRCTPWYGPWRNKKAPAKAGARHKIASETLYAFVSVPAATAAAAGASSRPARLMRAALPRKSRR